MKRLALIACLVPAAALGAWRVVYHDEAMSIAMDPDAFAVVADHVMSAPVRWEFKREPAKSRTEVWRVDCTARSYQVNGVSATPSPGMVQWQMVDDICGHEARLRGAPRR